MKKRFSLFTDPYDEQTEELKVVDGEEVDEELEAETTSEYEEASNPSLRVTEAKMVVSTPRSHEECRDIATYLLQKKAVVVNTLHLQPAVAMRLLDYLQGVVFAIGGSSQKIDTNSYLFAPANLPVDGVVEDD